jgi:3-deoxy-manno-octulosonate cytidylyltransferase (CMP-KDO synthetase)
MFYCVIPARYDSSRLPGKPLADIAGTPMIVRVASQAAKAGAEDVVVATDDRRIVDVVEQAGFEAALTDPGHPSGSDRVMEVVDARGWDEDAIVINVQGDEPLIPPEVIRQLADGMAARTGVSVATLCATLDDLDSVRDPNVVKVVRNRQDLALYFSRAPIPVAREGFPKNLREADLWQRHIGIYGYRVAALRRFVALDPSPLERCEHLEQLRLLENGINILVLNACKEVPGGVDTLEDLQRIIEHCVAHRP